jgi:hypothetical protein
MTAAYLVPIAHEVAAGPLPTGEVVVSLRFWPADAGPIEYVMDPDSAERVARNLLSYAETAREAT